MPSAALLLASTLLAAQPLDANTLLDRGPIVSVEQDAHGKFVRCTALARIDAPIAKVWQVVTDFANYARVIPKVKRSEIVRATATEVDVRFELETPGMNTRYVMRHTLHPESHTIDEHWSQGDTRGSAWVVHLEAEGEGRTLLSYSGASRNFSRILESLEDEQQTLSMGLNVAAALMSVKAFKRQAEAP